MKKKTGGKPLIFPLEVFRLDANGKLLDICGAITAEGKFLTKTK